MGMKKYRFAGLDRDVWLPDDIKVTIDLVPASVKNVVSGQYFTGQTSYTQHETANFNRGANARMHRNWLHSGASGSYVGFNFVVDDNEIIQLTRLDQVTWAAGTPDGNRYSYHSELCVNNDIDHTKARRNAAALAGGIFAAKGWNTNNLRQHRYWTGKWCPKLMLDQGYWPQFVNQVANFIKEAKSDGKTTTPVPSISAFKVGDTLRVKESLNVRQGYSTSYKIVTTLTPGTQVKVISDGSGIHTKTNDGYTWFNVSGAFGTGWAASDWLEKIPEAPATKDVVVNGITFKPVPKGTKFKLEAATNVREWASTDSKVIRTLPAGTIIEPTYEVDGDEVAGVKRWFVLETPSKPGRIWSGTAKKV